MAHQAPGEQNLRVLRLESSPAEAQGLERLLPGETVFYWYSISTGQMLLQQCWSIFQTFCLSTHTQPSAEWRDSLAVGLCLLTPTSLP